ncbi:metallophosphoesterase family protein [Pseudomonas aeruginosa]
MKFAVLSDSHLEREAMLDRLPDLLPEPGSVDALLALGDLTSGPLLPEFAKRARDHLECDVLITAGNHEYYACAREKQTMFEMQDIWREQFSKIDHAHLLLDEGITFGDVSIFGSTWWTNFRAWGVDYVASAMMDARTITDFRMIVTGYSYNPLAEDIARELRMISAQEMLDMNLSAVAAYRKWYESTPGKKVLATHFPMLMEFRHPSFPVSPYFVSADDLLLQQFKPDALVCGHTHFNVRGTLQGIPCTSNMHGYRSEEGRIGFDPNYFFEV